MDDEAIILGESEEATVREALEAALAAFSSKNIMGKDVQPGKASLVREALAALNAAPTWWPPANEQTDDSLKEAAVARTVPMICGISKRAAVRGTCPEHKGNACLIVPWAVVPSALSPASKSTEPAPGEAKGGEHE